MSEHDRAESGPPAITVRVFAPNETDPREFTFEKTMKVSDAAGEAATQLPVRFPLPS